MLFRKKDIFKNANIKDISKNLVDVISFTVQKYWEVETSTKLYAMNNFKELRDEKLISKIDFFSSMIKIPKHKPIIIRLGKDFIENFLNETLNNSSNKFDLTKLTPLEIKILNNFCDFVYKKLKEVILPQEKVKLSEKSEVTVNSMFFIKDKKGNTSHIMVSLPYDRMDFKEIEKTNTLTDDMFFSSKTNVKIIAGKTKLTLDELQNLAKDDIVLLEDSNITKLTLCSGELVKSFNVKPNPALIFNVDNEEEDEEGNEINNNEVIMSKNLWDDIQIEINAEFEKVKMTIGELKQITQGQIVDLGSVFDNEISLYVEDKKVAKGELLIINDRYAVRLDEVLSNNTKNPEITKPAQTKEAPKAQAQPPKQEMKTQPKGKESEDEEFDYSDFEN